MPDARSAARGVSCERKRYSRDKDELRDRAQKLLAACPELGLRWDVVKGGYTGNYFESTILTICLKEPLRHWKTAQNTVKRQVLAITDHFIT